MFSFFIWLEQDTGKDNEPVINEVRELFLHNNIPKQLMNKSVYIFLWTVCLLI